MTDWTESVTGQTFTIADEVVRARPAICFIFLTFFRDQWVLPFKVYHKGWELGEPRHPKP